MQNFFKLVGGLLVLAGGLGVAHFTIPHSVPRVAPILNRYQVAQRESVLIVSPNGGQGTGVVFRKDTRVFVLTAAHVVAGFSKVDVRIVIHNDDHKVGYTSFTGRVVALDSLVDAALIYVDAPTNYFRFAEFDSLIPPAVGTPVFHCGNFLGEDFDTSISLGVVANVGVRPNGAWPWAVTDETTCAISPGSSGGPVFNSTNDKVIGLVVGLVPNLGDPVKVYIPVRVIAAWASLNRLSWIFDGTPAPLVLPSYVPPPPEIPVLIPLLSPEKKKK